MGEIKCYTFVPPSAYNFPPRPPDTPPPAPIPNTAFNCVHRPLSWATPPIGGARARYPNICIAINILNDMTAIINSVLRQQWLVNSVIPEAGGIVWDLLNI